MPAPIWARALLKGITAAGGTLALFTVYGSVDEHLAATKTNPWPFHTPSISWDSNWDKREPESLLKISRKDRYNDNILEEKKDELEKLKSRRTRHLFLIRHGQYCIDADSDEKKCLTPLGREQAKMTGLRLKELDFPYLLLVRSTMPRAMETGQIISEELPTVPVVNCDLLREGAPIPPEPPVSHWRPEAQQFHEDGARIEAAFRKYFHRAEPCQDEDSYEIIVCHANVIRYFLCRALQFPPEAWLRFTLHNSSITWVAIHPSGRVVVRAVGDAGHIPKNKLSTT